MKRIINALLSVLLVMNMATFVYAEDAEEPVEPGEITEVITEETEENPVQKTETVATDVTITELEDDGVPQRDTGIVNTIDFGVDYINSLPISQEEKDALIRSLDVDYGYRPEMMTYDASDINPVGLPSCYDLRDYGLVTSVKNQGQYGTCWTFATMASGESFLLQKGVYNPDLSELHLAAYTYLGTSNPTTGNYDSMVPTKLPETIQNYLDIGGNANIAEKVLASGVGPVTENRVSYATTVATACSNRSSWCYTQDYQLKSTAKAAMSSKSAVKQLLMDYGALAVSYYEDSYYYNSTNNSYYNKYYNSTNHAVTLVGWDDNFSKNKFAPYTPKNNGAWLIKNSWGTTGAAGRKEGYFWISYEDAGLLTGNAYKFIMDPKTTDHTYSYDGNASTNYWYASNSITGANIFTANYANETVREAGFYTMASNTKYTVYVYKNVTAGKPTSGTLVDKVSGTAKYPGYHTVKFSKDVFLTSGTKYSIVVKLSKSNTKVKMATCGSEDWGWLRLDNDCNAGESYLKDGSSWVDISKKYYENVRIQAMTINRVPNTSLSISNPGTMIPGQSTSMGLSYRSDTTDRVYISSSDSSVVDVENNIYVAKKPGVATITVKCGDYTATQTITVIPSTPTITSVKYASSTSLKVSWDKVSKASGYYVYRSTDEGVSWKKIATITKGSTTSYTDKDRSAGKRYVYMVTAYTTYKSKKYYSLRSQAVEGIMLKKTTVTAKSAGYQSVLVSWKSVKGADGYYFCYRKKGASNWDYQEVGSNLTSLTATDLDYYTTYEFRVQPFCNANRYLKADETTYVKMGGYVEYLGPNSSTVTAKTVLSKPVMSGGNTYYEAEHGSEVNEVIWYKVEGAEYYEIWRATSSTGTYKLAGTVMQNDVQSILEDGRYFWKKDETYGKTRYYKVRAVRSYNGVNKYSSFGKVIAVKTGYKWYYK